MQIYEPINFNTFFFSGSHQDLRMLPNIADVRKMPGEMEVEKEKAIVKEQFNTLVSISIPREFKWEKMEVEPMIQNKL